MKRHNTALLGPKPDHMRRLEDLARDVLRDIGMLANTKYEAVQSKHFDPTQDPQVPYGQMVPAIKLEFEHADEGSKPAFLVHVVNWANGSIANDETIKYRIRKKVEEYLRSISAESGFNTPEDMRLDWEFYS